jgi:hypothetical protein
MKTMRTTKVLLNSLCLGFLGAIAAVESGCVVAAVGVAGAAGAGTVAYIRGELDATLSNDLKSVDTASKRAIQELQFAYVSESSDAFTSEIIARTADDKKIDIKLIKQADTLTKVQIRVATFGDEPMSRAILDRIKADL